MQVINKAVASSRIIDDEREIGSRHYLFKIAPVKGTNYINVYGMDVTRRTKAEQAHLKSEKRYKDLIENLFEGIWLIDRDAVTVYVNSKMEDILGYEPGEMLGRPIFDFLGKLKQSVVKN